MALPKKMVLQKFFPASYRGPGASSVLYEKWSQAKPHDLILPYTMRRTTLTAVKGNVTKYWSPINGIPVHFETSTDTGSVAMLYNNPNLEPIRTTLTQCRNKAREKFTSKMSASAELMVDLLERKQTMDMLRKRVNQVDDTLKGIKRLALTPLSIPKLVRELTNILYLPRGITRKQRRAYVSRAATVIQDFQWRRGAKSMGALWLELHFGWEQLLKDIFETVEILDSPLTEKWIRTKASNRADFSKITRYSGKQFWYINAKVRCQANVFGLVKVDNPNAFKVAKLGFTNPGTWAWELIPFSFVIDWFININQWLKQWDEFFGITLTKCGYSEFFDGTSEGGWVDNVNFEECHGTAHSTSFQRFDTFPSVVLNRKRITSISAVRAATSIALLTQFMGRGHH